MVKTTKKKVKLKILTLLISLTIKPKGNKNVISKSKIKNKIATK